MAPATASHQTTAAEETTRNDGPPDIVIFLADDMGFSDVGCFGGEIDTPNLDRLGRDGIRFTHFYNSPRCSPSRASLLTGLHPHQVGIGILTGDERPHGYPGDLSEDCLTLAEALAATGYATYLSGKWHLAADTADPNDAWPTRRGFQHFFGTLQGAGSYYAPCSLTRGELPATQEYEDPSFFYTDAIADNAAGFIEQHVATRGQQPLFLYCPFTAPHWPLHASDADIASYRGRFDAGWDELRAARMAKLVAEGILDDSWDLSARDPQVPPWSEVTDPSWEASRMEVYAAQVTQLDRAVGRVVTQLEEAGRLDNTMIIFLSDNGGCAEDIPTGPDSPFRESPLVPRATRDGRHLRLGNGPDIDPGPEDTYASYGIEWANLSNTPFREYKHWVHEGGISTPFIVHWPNGPAESGSLCHEPSQLVDVMPTLLAVTGAVYPSHRNRRALPPLEGAPLQPLVRAEIPHERDLWWEHEGNAGLRRGRWKLVRKYPGDWELYDMVHDRTELTNLAAHHPDLVSDMSVAWHTRADRYGVIPREHVVAGYRRPTPRRSRSHD